MSDDSHALQKNHSLKVVKRILDSCASPSAGTPNSAGKPARNSPAGRQGGRKSMGGGQKDEASPLPKDLLGVRRGTDSPTPPAATPPAATTPQAGWALGR